MSRGAGAWRASRDGSGRARLAPLMLGLALCGAGPLEARPQARDAVPDGVPPGFEPVDVREEVDEIEREQVRKLEEQVDIEMHYQSASPERMLRARYGGATWNLYEPYE